MDGIFTAYGLSLFPFDQKGPNHFQFLTGFFPYTVISSPEDRGIWAHGLDFRHLTFEEAKHLLHKCFSRAGLQDMVDWDRLYIAKQAATGNRQTESVPGSKALIFFKELKTYTMFLTGRAGVFLPILPPPHAVQTTLSGLPIMFPDPGDNTVHKTNMKNCQLVVACDKMAGMNATQLSYTLLTAARIIYPQNIAYAADLQHYAGSIIKDVGRPSGKVHFINPAAADRLVCGAFGDQSNLGYCKMDLPHAGTYHLNFRRGTAIQYLGPQVVMPPQSVATFLSSERKVTRYQLQNNKIPVGNELPNLEHLLTSKLGGGSLPRVPGTDSPFQLIHLTTSQKGQACYIVINVNSAEHRDLLLAKGLEMTNMAFLQFIPTRISQEQ